MKKILSILTALALLFALSSCGDSDSVSSDDVQSNIQSVESEDVNSTQSEITDDVSSTNLDYTPLKVNADDIKIFEKMLNNHSWLYTAPFDSEKAKYKDVVENYLFNINNYFGMYNNFWKVPANTKWAYTDPDNKYFVYYALDADKADWVIENVFGLKPDRSQKSKVFHYSGDTLYIGGELADGESLRSYKVIDYINLGDGTIGITVLSYYESDYDESEIRYENPVISYFIGELKKDEKIGKYWGVKRFSNTEKLFKTKIDSNIDIFNAYNDKLYEKQMYANENYNYIRAQFSPTYMLYDIDGNGVDELIIGMGRYEAEAEFEFYTYDNGIKLLGTVPAGDTVLAKPDDGKGIYSFYARMGHVILKRITLKNGKIKSEVIFEKENDNRPYDEINYLSEYYGGNIRNLIEKISEI